MSKQTIIIRPIAGRAKNPKLTFQYVHPVTKKLLILGMDRRVYEDKLPEHIKKFDYTFNEVSRELRFVFYWGDDEKFKTNVVAEKKVKQFFAEHPGIVVVGAADYNSNAGALHEMLVLEDEERRVYDRSQLKIKAANIINSLPSEKLRDLAFFFDLNPSTRSDMQVWLDLAHPETGRLMVSEEFGHKLIEMYNTPENKDILMRALIKKAVILNKINFRNGKYYIAANDEPIGMVEDDIVLYYKANAKMYEFLTREVGISDFTSQEGKQSAPRVENDEAPAPEKKGPFGRPLKTKEVKVVHSDHTPEEQNKMSKEEIELRKECKKRGKIGWNNEKPEKLQVWLDGQLEKEASTSK